MGIIKRSSVLLILMNLDPESPAHIGDEANHHTEHHFLPRIVIRRFFGRIITARTGQLFALVASSLEPVLLQSLVRFLSFLGVVPNKTTLESSKVHRIGHWRKEIYKLTNKTLPGQNQPYLVKSKENNNLHSVSSVLNHADLSG